ncbi:MAG: thioredoxin domain-containing protein [Chloroflexi bacterium HGW-Chloroflexi-3]|nr:MAG: thioredoxin domain-containing protein [Chloroflexi bacterium HGW-Chloroflexi-3]
MTNQLAHTTSPYLLQHAGNPVDWYPWGPEALQRARQEDKPIFLSIGYAACHWCHVMAHESFEDPAIAALMNQHYINIKVDREERPDLDGIYMSAVVAFTGQGGWPMSVFLTPDLVPFYGGTYFPPRPRYGMPSFHEVLLALADYWHNQRDEVIQSGQRILDALLQQKTGNASGGSLTPETTRQATRILLSSYDWDHGGWGTAPKFPQPMALGFLLRRHHGSGDPNAQSLRSVQHALDAMSRGGMYDVVGGGFARYSTDEDWLVPHFEKMLYDNAQLTSAYLHAWQISREPRYRRVVEETLGFVQRELLAPQGGFYSSLDADSEGVEGKFYVWTLDEIHATLGEVDALFESAYGLTQDGSHGGWEGKIVLQRVATDEELAQRFAIPAAEIPARLAQRHAQLLSQRTNRVRPGTDDKVLTSWNGLMLSAFAEGARSLENSTYLQVAQCNADFILREMLVEGRLQRSWRQGQTSPEVFLEDYAALILGLLELYQSDFNPRWFVAAQALTGEMIEQFHDPDGGFFDTTRDAETVLLRPKDLQDNATPSGNALATEALLKMAAFSDNEEWLQLAEESLAQVAGMAAEYPTAFSRWLSAADFYQSKTRQIALIGDPQDPQMAEFLLEIRSVYRPNTVVAAAGLPLPEGSPALLHDRPMMDGKPTAYVCEGFVCRRPVTSVSELKELLNADR